MKILESVKSQVSPVLPLTKLAIWTFDMYLPSSGLASSLIAYSLKIYVKISMARAFRSVFSSFNRGYFDVWLYALGRIVKVSPYRKFMSSRVVPFSVSLMVMFWFDARLMRNEQG